ncbi:MAG: hypothetical protein PHQ59_04140 [Candidatus Daviesbacteria bacterium]|nr:hypothetical protein [Candidatus Daviesbacteria bacterium]
MQDTSTTSNKTNNSPFTQERKKTSARVVNREESLDGQIDSIGFFNEKPEPRGFNATGSIDLSSTAEYKVNPLTIINEGPVTQSNIFKVPGEFVEFADKTVNIGSKIAGVVGSAAVEGFDAGKDLLNQVIGIDNTPESKKPVDPQKQEEETKKKIENEFTTQAQEDTEARIQAIRQKLEAMAQLEAKRQQTAELAGLQASFQDVLAGNGEVRTDLETPIENKARELQKKRTMAANGPIRGASKKGGQGVGISNDDNKSSETRSTAQTAVG